MRKTHMCKRALKKSEITLPRTDGEDDDDATEYSLGRSSGGGWRPPGTAPDRAATALPSCSLLSTTTAQALALSYETGKKLEAEKWKKLFCFTNA